MKFIILVIRIFKDNITKLDITYLLCSVLVNGITLFYAHIKKHVFFLILINIILGCRFQI